MAGTTETMAEVLAVADDWALRDVLRLLLDHLGYDVREAEDGVSALEALEEAAAPLIVLLDVQLAGMGGLDVLRAVGRDPCLGFRHAFVLLSEEQVALPKDVWPLVEGLSIPVLGKPLDLDLLFETVAVRAADLRSHGTRANPAR